MAGLVGHSCLVYLNDLFFFSKDHDAHVGHLPDVFKCLQKFGLTLKRKKCTFAAPEVDLLGFVLCAKGIWANPDKIQVISDLPAPSSVKEVPSFLGMAVTITKPCPTMHS
jgi:hypothetical protein